MIQAHPKSLVGSDWPLAKGLYTAFWPLSTNRLSMCKASSPTLPRCTSASAVYLSVASILRSLNPSASTIWLSAPGTFSSAGRQFVPPAAWEREAREGRKSRKERDADVCKDRVIFRKERQKKKRKSGGEEKAESSIPDGPQQRGTCSGNGEKA